MRTLLDWLFGFFILGITDADGGADAGADADADAGADAGGDTDTDSDAGAGEGDDAGDLDVDTELEVDDGGAAAAAEAAKALKDAEEKTARLQAELDAARRGTAPAGQTEDQRQHEAEETKLRDSKTTELERWKINSNRTLRENKRASSLALFQAQDLSDKTAFNQLAITKPAIHKRYAERVEAEIVRMRSQGQNAPREAVLRYLIGNDALDGKLSSKKAAAQAAAKPIDRGQSPGARSDVAARGRLTEAQKREKRLEGAPL